MPTDRQIDTEGLAARIETLPGFARVREAAELTSADAYLVGGAVRDAMLGEQRADLDVAVVGDHLALARALGGELRVHERFATATVTLEGHEIDVTMARAESYPRPGALPDVSPADLAADLRRRDFTVNAVAVAVRGPGQPIDPCAGIDDLREGVLRVMHERSLTDDPTRALRAARYAARLDLEPEPATLGQLRAVDLSTVSADRVAAELEKLAREPEPGPALALLGEWGVMFGAGRAAELAAAVAALPLGPGWPDLVGRPEAVLATLDPELVERARALAAERPDSPARAVERARGRPGAELAVALALGAEWVDTYVERWRRVELEIRGDDLLAAGVPEGEAIGRGLAAALAAKLDGEALDAEDELRIALVAAGDPRPAG